MDQNLKLGLKLKTKLKILGPKLKTANFLGMINYVFSLISIVTSNPLKLFPISKRLYLGLRLTQMDNFFTGFRRNTKGNILFTQNFSDLAPNCSKNLKKWEIKKSIETRAWKSKKNLTGYGCGLERKTMNSFGYISGYLF